MHVLQLLALHKELRCVIFGGHPVFHAFGFHRPCVTDMDVVLFFRLWEFEASLTTEVVVICWDVLSKSCLLGYSSSLPSISDGGLFFLHRDMRTTEWTVSKAHQQGLGQGLFTGRRVS